MTSIPAHVRICLKCGENYVGRLCPKCTTRAEFLADNPIRLQGERFVTTPENEEFTRIGPRTPATAPSAAPKPARGMGAPALNKTEQRWQDAHPSHIPFPMSLRWGKCMSYKPDFMLPDFDIDHAKAGKLIEVKGAHIFDRDIVRFKGCAAEWGWLFEFQMWQWKNGKWTRLY